MKHICLLTGCAALLAGLLLAAAPASAFCVYNKTDEEIHVYQWSGNRFSHGFSRDIKPGERACCNWKDKDCNKKGHKHSIVTFVVSKYNTGVKHDCSDVKVKAGGWMDVYKRHDGFRCTAHD